MRSERGIVGAFGGECYQQVDKNLAAAQELYERSERQYGAWAGLLYTHLSYYDYYRAASDFSRRIAT